MAITIYQDIIPTGRVNRPGTLLQGGRFTYVTVHNTANTDPWADAENHADYLARNPDSEKRKVSWHFTVDDKGWFFHLPLNEVGYHTSTRTGNNTSIGIEMCEYEGMDFAKAKENLIKLLVHIMIKYKTGLNNIVSHKYWSGKYCPHVLLDQGWQNFINDVNVAWWNQHYTIQSGDKLSGIATKWGVATQDILSVNPSIENPDVINVGQIILIPIVVNYVQRVVA